MRVLVLADQYDIAEAHLYLGLASREVQLCCVCGSESANLERLRAAGIPTITFPFRSRFDIKAIRAVRALLRATPYDLIHSLSARALSNALIASLGFHAKHIAYRGTAGHLSRLDPTSWFSFLNPRLQRIICVSDAVVRYLQERGVSSDRLVRIYKGHRLEWYEFTNRPALSQFGIPDGAFVVGCTANMRPVKGVDLLIEAARLLIDLPDLHLLLVGEVRDESVVQALREHPLHDRIHLTGYRKDAAALMGQCDVFVMPSRNREGLPKAAIEAMAQGVMPLVSDAGGLPELVKHNECGLVVPAGDYHALAKALQWSDRNATEVHRFGNAAKERIGRLFNVEQTIEQTFAVYESLVRGRVAQPAPKGIRARP